MTDEERALAFVVDWITGDEELANTLAAPADLAAQFGRVRFEESQAIAEWLRRKCQPRLADLLERGEHLAAPVEPRDWQVQPD